MQDATAKRTREAVEWVASDVWCEIVSWLPTSEQLLAGATCRGFRAVGQLAIVGPLTVASDDKFEGAMRLFSVGRLRGLASLTLTNLRLASLAPVVATAPSCLRAVTLKGLDELTDEAVGAACAAIGARLQSVNVRECRCIADETVVAVAAFCPNLRHFRFKAHESPLRQVTDNAIVALAAGAPRLVAFDVDGCAALTDVALEALAASCRDLQCLYVRKACVGLTDRGVVAVARAVRLVECSLVSPADAVVAAVAGPRLRRLTLDRSSPALGDASLHLVGRTCPNLLQFKLFAAADEPPLKHLAGPGSRLRGVTDAGLVAVARGCSNLESLNLVACGEFAAVNCARALPRLRSLSLSGRSVVTDALLEALGTTCSRLHRVFLSASSRGRLTPAGIRHLQPAQNLKYLYVGSPRIALDAPFHRRDLDADVASLVVACPRLVKLTLHVDFRDEDRHTYALPANCVDRATFRAKAAYALQALAAGSRSRPSVRTPRDLDRYRMLRDDAAPVADAVLLGGHPMPIEALWHH